MLPMSSTSTSATVDRLVCPGGSGLKFGSGLSLCPGITPPGLGDDPKLPRSIRQYNEPPETNKVIRLSQPLPVIPATAIVPHGAGRRSGAGIQASPNQILSILYIHAKLPRIRKVSTRDQGTGLTIDLSATWTANASGMLIRSVASSRD